MSSEDTTPRLTPLARLPRDQRGAMFLMGIPLCFFMIGLLYFVIGLGEDLVLRERMQDAADAGALAAAIVHARGMNLIAMINQVMAALVSLLIMVRMLEALLIAAIAIAGALAYPTFGASLSIIPPAEAAEEEADDAWQELKDVIEPIVEALHVLEIGIQYGMPVVAEARTIAIVPKYEPVADFGFVIPGHFPLPLKNGDWSELCQKAGGDAADMITFPLEKILPVPPVYSAIHSAMEAISHQFSDLFCGEQGTSTGLQIPEQMPAVPLDQEVDKNLPPLAKAEECAQPNASLGASMQVGSDGLPIKVPDEVAAQRASEKDKQIEDKDKVCKAAAEEQARSKPAPDGSPNTDCGYAYGASQDKVACSAGACRAQDGSACKEFSEKVEQAGEQCKPGANKNVYDYNYQERALTWTAQLVPKPNCGALPEQCTYTVSFATPRPKHTDKLSTSDKPPCGSNPTGTIGPEWRESANYQADGEYDENEYMCSQPHKVVDPNMLEAKKDGMTLDDWRREFASAKPEDSRWTEISTPYEPPPRPSDLAKDADWPPPTQQPPNVPSDTVVFTGSWTAVTFMHSCDQKTTNFADSPDYKKTQQDFAKQQAGNTVSKLGKAAGGDSSGGSDCGEGQEVHMKMEDPTKDNVLGGEAFQMRCVAFRKKKDQGAKKVVRSVPLRLLSRQNTESGDPLGTFDFLTKIFGAQAEYYFNTGYAKHDGQLDQTELSRDQWTWHMWWKARLRRLRILSDDDSDSSSSSSSSNSAPAGCDIDSPSTGPDQSYTKAAASPERDSSSDQSEDSNEGGGTSSVSTLQQFQSLFIH
jgi:hypothetical protein